MKQHNTFTLKEFIIRAVGVYFITLIIFCLFIFKVIPGCSLLVQEDGKDIHGCKIKCGQTTAGNIQD